MDTTCTHDGCSRTEYARGFCKSHYSKLRHKGLLPKLPKPPPKFCKAEGCNKPFVAKGFCQQHYREFKVANTPHIYQNIETKRQVRARETKKTVMGMMGGKCAVCGFQGNPACFDFHHLDPSEKERQPKSLMRNIDLDTIMKELNKCILVCKNCHADIHHPLEAP